MSTPVSAHWSVGLEEGEDGAVRAHALSLLGCEEIGADPEKALDLFSAALQRRLRDLRRLGRAVPGPEEELRITVDEWVRSDARVAAGQSVACFDRDRQPLLDAERLAGVQLLGDLRGRLLPHIRRAPNAELEAIGSPEANVRVILDELAQAHWWTLTRLGASPLAEIPDRVVARLDTSMALVVQHMTHPRPEMRHRVVVIDGEEWTPRKVLRRLLWLEWSLGGAALHYLLRGERVSR
ncbi:MAG TPA: hypothetical protein VMN39_03370 [Longimicrobiaceae bacterium]|nr:hypothetical protein [Longimicrobiaceae bacterium]